MRHKKGSCFCVDDVKCQLIALVVAQCIPSFDLGGCIHMQIYPKVYHNVNVNDKYECDKKNQAIDYYRSDSIRPNVNTNCECDKM